MTDKPMNPKLGKHMQAFVDNATDDELNAVLKYISAQLMDWLEL